MNTIEFAIQDGVPYAIDFLNPAPDFERDRITEFYFEQVVDKMARLVIDRALSGEASNSWPRWEEMVGAGASSRAEGPQGFTGAPKSKAAQMAVGQTKPGPNSPVQQSAVPESRSCCQTATEAEVSTASPQPAEGNAAEIWHALLRPALKSEPAFAENFLKELRGAKLTFGDRVHCPFLRPFFLSVQDEKRVRPVAETIADLGERVAVAALEDKNLLAQFHLRPEEERLARLPAGYGRVSTASRLDAFLLPESLKFAEYNGESPAGAGYSETLGEIFSELPLMAQFSRRFEVHGYPLSAKLLDALVMSYLDWGGTSKRPQIAIVDFKGVPTWSEFEILKARFEKMGVPTLVADPRELVFDGKKLTADGKKIDLVYRRALINDIVAHPAECAALVKAYTANAVCVANSFRCKIPHVKTFFAVLTDERNGGAVLPRRAPGHRAARPLDPRGRGCGHGALRQAR